MGYYWISYSPKESLSPLWVPLVWVALFSLVYWFWNFTTLRTVTFIWWEGGGAYFWVKIWLFSKLFGSCLRSIWVLLKTLKAYLRVYFWLERLRNDPQTRDFRSKLCSFWRFSRVVFDHFWGQKSRFLDFLKVLLELFMKCLGIIFGLKRPTFGCIFSSKGPYMSSKIKIFGQILALDMVINGHFLGNCLYLKFFFGVPRKP